MARPPSGRLTPEQADLGSQALALAGDFEEFYRWATIEDKDFGLIHPDPAWRHCFEPQYSQPIAISLSDALAAGMSCVVLKARQLGITTLIRIRDLFDAQFSTPMPISVASRREKEAWEYIRLVKLIYDHLPPVLTKPMEKKPSKEEFPIQDGGRLYSFPATEDAGRSFVVYRHTFDEFGFHPEQEAASRAVDPQARQVIRVSTANGQNHFLSKFDAVWEGRGASNEVAFFYPWFVRPDRQNADGTPSQSWYQNELRRFLADESKGGYEDFLAEFPATIEEAKSARTGLYFGEEFTQENITSVDPWPWVASNLHVAGVDFGGRHDAAAADLIGFRHRDYHFHQFEEYHQPRGSSVEAIGAWLLGQAPRPRYVFCDPSQETAIETLRRMGLNAMGLTPRTRKLLNNREAGLNLLGTLLGDNRFTIANRCAVSLSEFESYYHKVAKHPITRAEFDTSTPVRHHGDHIDAKRYAAVGARDLLGEYRAPDVLSTLSGRPRATQAV